MTKTHAFRLHPGADLKRSIQDYVNEQGIKGGWIACGVGSLTQYNIRFANRQAGTQHTGHFEITGLTGTVGLSGLHIHITISNGKGRTLGGHLLEGNLIYTTAEIIIQETKSLVFSREEDSTTGWKELVVEKSKGR